jgi:hypothetical protein
MILTQTYLTNAQGYFGCQLAKLMEYYSDRASIGNTCEDSIKDDLVLAAVLVDILCGINLNDKCITHEGTCLIIDKLYELLKDCC